jgi:hypothetical protein
MSVRSKFAFQFSGERLGKKLYFWTFTFRTVHELKDARQRWSKFLEKGLKRKYPQASGLRVFELHKHHGLHIHMCTNRFLWVQDLIAIGKKYGFGRTNIKRANEGALKYLMKYLQKERPKCMKGFRLWQGFGKIDFCKCKDIVINSTYTRIYRALKLTCNGFAKASWWQRDMIVWQQYLREDLPEYFLRGKTTVYAPLHIEREFAF